MIYPDFPPDKVKISLCQPAKLADTHPGSQQYHKLVVILAVGFILPDEIHPKCLMLLRHRNALLRIVGNHIDQFEVKGIPTDHIFIVRHLESRFDNAPNAGEGAVSLSVLVQLHDPFLRVRNLDVPDGTITEIFLLHQIQHEVIADFGIVTYALLDADIAFQQLNDGNFACGIINAIVKLLLNFLFFFTQFFQIGGIHCLAFAANVCVPILINQVFPLALSCPQDASLVVLSLFGHCQTPFRDGKSLDMTHLLYHIKAPIYTTNFK